ncbi:MAG: response regulator transcription factor [Ruminococcus sp.]|nr:response regulator transcription factor [Ruminococcus sp.]
MDNSNAAILVADDDREITAGIARLLELEGYRVIKAYDGLQALEALTENKIQLIIMDVMMPKMDGLSATMRIRQEQNIPIIILSAKTEDTDKVLGLSMGADDYISKPYSPAELVARVRSQLRRYLHLGDVKSSQAVKDAVTVGGLTLNIGEKQLYLDGEPVRLTATEFKIMRLLMENAGRVYPAEEIYEKVWNEEAFAVENTVMVHIRRIREKIEINPKEPKYLKVVWGIGYKIEKL